MLLDTARQDNKSQQRQQQQDIITPAPSLVPPRETFSNRAQYKTTYYYFE
jgi:hypothetical protein